MDNIWHLRNGELAPLASPDFIPSEGEYNLLEVLANAGFDTDIRCIPGRGSLNDTTILEGRDKMPGGFMYIMLVAPLNQVVFLLFLKDFGELITAINHFHVLFRLNLMPQLIASEDDEPSDGDSGDDNWFSKFMQPGEN